MNDAGYRVVYDVTQASPDWGFPAVGVLFVIIGAGLWATRHRLPGGWRGPFLTSPRLRTAFTGFFLGFALLWTTCTAEGVLGSHLRARQLLRDGTAQVVEGPVQDFHPMPSNGHGTESFVVEGVRFAYSDYVIRTGFRQTSARGGPIRSGLRVRIHYSNAPGSPDILKLEIKEN